VVERLKGPAARFTFSTAQVGNDRNSTRTLYRGFDVTTGSSVLRVIIEAPCGISFGSCDDGTSCCG